MKHLAAGVVCLVLSTFSLQMQAQSYAPLITDPFGAVASGGNLYRAALADLDNDGDLDLYGTVTVGMEGALVYYQNTGSRTAPVFAAGVTSFTLSAAAMDPSFADLDADGDLDLMIGNNWGNSYYYKNTGTVSAPVFAAPVMDPFGLYSLGYYASHTFADLDGDNDLDLLLGEYYGGLYYWENIGTATTPNFAAPLNTPFGLTGIPNAPKPAFLDMDLDGDKDILAGRNDGSFCYFENVGTPTAPSYTTMVLNPFGLTILPDWFSAPAPADLDFDGDLDIFAAGNSLFRYFQNTAPVVAPPKPLSTTLAANKVVCNGTSVVLTASGTSIGRLGWYDAPAGGNRLGGGSPYTTPTLTASTTYYVQDSTGAGASIGRTAVTITVAPHINTQTLTVAQTVLCGSGTTSVQIGASQTGVNYYLRDDANDAIVAGPRAGTGAALSFTTGAISSSMVYNVAAETLTAGLTCQQEMANTVTVTVKQPALATRSVNVCYGANYGYADGTSATNVVANQMHVSTMAGQAANGCDSILTEHLIALPYLTGAYTATICAEETRTINGTVYSRTHATGTEVFHNSGAHGCDSTVTVNLTMLPALTHTVATTICAEETLTINGTVYSRTHATGTEVFHNSGAHGCDSTVTVNLTMLPALTHTVATTICAEETLTINGTVYSRTHATGTEVFHNSGAHGCDSTVTVNLNALPALAHAINTTICAEESMMINGTTYDASHPTGTEVFYNIGLHGCDSTVTVNLNVLPALTGAMTQTLCAKEAVTINGTVYNAAHPTGTEVFHNIGLHGCDSALTIHLSFKVAINVSVTANGVNIGANQSGATYQWIDCSDKSPIGNATSQTFVATHNGSYAVVVTQNGCSDTSACVSVTSVGIHELQATALLVLYPNPVETSVTIAGLDALTGIGEIGLWDLSGKRVMAIDPAQPTADLSGIAAGVYQVRIVHSQGVETIKLIRN